MHVNPRIDGLLRRLNHPALPHIDLSLERMWQLLSVLGNPQNTLPPVIHVAGTNGKGSTLAFLRAIYQASGRTVHSYTSPHLVRFNERIQLAGHDISDAQLEPLLERVAKTGIQATFFEATTAAAFLAFTEHAADILLLETGLGGRLDATNVVSKPLATIITTIDMDHKEFLGDTLTAIATEKAGIMKEGTPCIVGVQPLEVQRVLIAKAAEINCPIWLHGRDWQFTPNDNGITLSHGERNWQTPVPNLQGQHQHHNAALALMAAHAAGLPLTAAACNAVMHAHWPARLQRLQHGPLVENWGGPVYLDGGHNPHAAEAMAEWIGDAPMVMLCGMMRRKDAVAFFTPLASRITALVAIPIPGEDAYDPNELAHMARKAGIRRAQVASTPQSALALLQECHSTPLLIAGSLYLAGEILKNHS